MKKLVTFLLFAVLSLSQTQAQQNHENERIMEVLVSTVGPFENPHETYK